MKRTMAVLVFALGLSLCSLGQAFEGRSPHDMLSQLPADKELLFHQTMREVREGTAGIQEQIKTLEMEIKGVLTASEFDATLYLKKTGAIRELQLIVRAKMDEAMANLAGQFTAEERGVLAEMFSRRPGPKGPPPGR
jgi:uncharacterized membrane protein